MFEPVRRLISRIRKRDIHCPHCHKQIHGKALFGVKDEIDAQLFINNILKAIDQHIEVVFTDPKK